LLLAHAISNALLHTWGRALQELRSVGAGAALALLALTLALVITLAVALRSTGAQFSDCDDRLRAVLPTETVVAHALALLSVAFALVTTTTLRSAGALLELTGALGTIGMSIIAFTGAVLASTNTVAVLWALLG